MKSSKQAPQTNKEAPELDAKTKGNVKKVQAALGSSAPPTDIIVLYLRENNNDPNEVVAYILDTDEADLWTSHKKKKAVKPTPEPLPVFPRETNTKVKPSAKPVKEKERIEAAPARVTSLAPTEQITRPSNHGISFVEALKAVDANTKKPHENVVPVSHHQQPMQEFGDDDDDEDDDIVVTTNNKATPEEDDDPAPWRTIPPPVQAPAAPAVVASPQKSAAVVSPKSMPRPLPPRVLQLRLPEAVSSLVDETFAFNFVPEVIKVPSPAAPPPPVQQRKEEQPNIDYVGAFAQPSQPNPSAQDPWMQPFTKPQPQQVPSNRGPAPPPQNRGGWSAYYGANNSGTMPYYPQNNGGNQTPGQQGNQGQATWNSGNSNPGSYNQQQGYGFPMPNRQFVPPYSQGNQQQGGQPVFHQGPMAQYGGRPVGNKSPSMFGGYSVTGDDSKRGGESEWNLK